ncbi:MAG: DUF192 domain-containing protein [Acidimicrobiales bacterium]
MAPVTLHVRHLRLLLWAALGVLGLGLWAFVLRGADEPADPYLVPVVSLPPGVDPPGDPARELLAGFDEVAITVQPADGSPLLAWCLLAALQAEQRSRGLMGVTDLNGYSGMAFVYDDDVQSGFWMRNTPMPLSIAWIDASGTLVHSDDMAPCEDRDDCPSYRSTGPYRSAIEVPQGQLGALGIAPGATVTIGGACAARV